MKFACLIEIPAFPIEYPLRPNESIILPAASPSGFLKIEPELGIVRGCVCDLLERWRSIAVIISERSPSFSSISASIRIPASSGKAVFLYSNDRSSRFSFSISPFRLILVTLRRTDPISVPSAPAFITITPPKEPGMPTRFSIPVSENFAACFAR